MLPTAFHKATESFREASADAVTGMFDSVSWTGGQLKKGFNPIKEEIAEIAFKTVNYIKLNWRHLVAYLFAWAAVVVSAGMMHGFQGVAIPLTIGISGGLGFGIIVGILSVKVFIPQFDPSGRKTHFHTFWNFLNWGINKFLDTIGTRQIMLSLAVAVIVTTATVFPYVMGGLFGIFMGNQIAYAAGMQKAHGEQKKKKELPLEEKLLRDMRKARAQQRRTQIQLETIAAHMESLHEFKNSLNPPESDT